MDIRLSGELRHLLSTARRAGLLFHLQARQPVQCTGMPSMCLYTAAEAVNCLWGLGLVCVRPCSLRNGGTEVQGRGMVVAAGMRVPRVRPHAPAVLGKGPWSRLGPRGMAMEVASFSRCALALHRTTDTVPLVPVQLEFMELPATTVGETPLPVKTQRRTMDCLLIFVHRVLLQSGFQLSLRKVQQGPAEVCMHLPAGRRIPALDRRHCTFSNFKQLFCLCIAFKSDLLVRGRLRSWWYVAGQLVCGCCSPSSSILSPSLRTQARPAIEYVSGEEGLCPLLHCHGN